jgi:hypothetical protein
MTRFADLARQRLEAATAGSTLKNREVDCQRLGRESRLVGHRGHFPSRDHSPGGGGRSARRTAGMIRVAVPA